jgi:uncharacterized protein
VSTKPNLKTPRTTVKRLAKRGDYDLDTVAAILDECLYCHIGFALDGQPFVIPTAYGRLGSTLYIHGSALSRTLNELAKGIPMCFTASLIDGLVLARSGFHSSINYRSVVVLGKAELVEGEQKLNAMEVISEHLAPGRWADLRPATRKEINATKVLKLDIAEASAKIRVGPPADDEDDYALSCWAGVLPLELVAGEPIADPRLRRGIGLPEYLRGYTRAPRPVHGERSKQHVAGGLRPGTSEK